MGWNGSNILPYASGIITGATAAMLSTALIGMMSMATLAPASFLLLVLGFVLLIATIRMNILTWSDGDQIACFWGGFRMGDLIASFLLGKYFPAAASARGILWEKIVQSVLFVIGLGITSEIPGNTRKQCAN